MKYQYAVNPEFNGVNALDVWKQQDEKVLEEFLNAAGEAGYEFFSFTAIGNPDPDEWRQEKIREQTTVCALFRRVVSVEVGFR